MNQTILILSIALGVLLIALPWLLLIYRRVHRLFSRGEKQQLGNPKLGIWDEMKGDKVRKLIKPKKSS